MAKVYAVACYWTMSNTVFVKAESKEEACEYMMRENIGLPERGSFYLESSFEADPDVTAEVSKVTLKDIRPEDMEDATK